MFPVKLVYIAATRKKLFNCSVLYLVVWFIVGDHGIQRFAPRGLEKKMMISSNYITKINVFIEKDVAKACTSFRTACFHFFQFDSWDRRPSTFVLGKDRIASLTFRPCPMAGSVCLLSLQAPFRDRRDIGGDSRFGGFLGGRTLGDVFASLTNLAFFRDVCCPGFKQIQESVAMSKMFCAWQLGQCFHEKDLY